MTVPGTQVHAHVNGLRPAVSYQFRIYAENELGRSQASDVSISKFNMQHRLRFTLPTFRTTRVSFCNSRETIIQKSIYTQDRSLFCSLWVTRRTVIFSLSEFHSVFS